MFNIILCWFLFGVVLILEIGNEEFFIFWLIVGVFIDGERIMEYLLDG